MAVIAGFCAGTAGTVLADLMPEYELPPLNYSATQPSNLLTEVEAKLRSAGSKVSAGDDRAWLDRILHEAGIPVESQVLVFSKTSFQRKAISPRRPRAIYFSDDCYIGWVPGGLIEAAVTDPQLGLVFYSFDPPGGGEPPEFARDAQCLSCHAGSMTRNWPGLMVRSVFTSEDGEPILSAGTFLIGHESPLAERWGGWYVTGEHGAERHMGNVFARQEGRQTFLDREAGANLTDLTQFFDGKPYPLLDSDIVALMVLEHQVQMHNRLAQGALRARKWIHYQRQLQKELGEEPTAELTGTAKRVVEGEAKKILEYLLFANEVELPEGGIRGAGRFEKAFAANARPDSKGRSLKDFDLESRLFKYRCSYMIYSQAFDALPEELKQEIYRRLYDGLTGSETPEEFAHLRRSERRAILEILRETKPGLPDYWGATTQRAGTS